MSFVPNYCSGSRFLETWVPNELVGVLSLPGSGLQPVITYFNKGKDQVPRKRRGFVQAEPLRWLQARGVGHDKDVMCFYCRRSVMEYLWQSVAIVGSKLSPTCYFWHKFERGRCLGTANAQLVGHQLAGGRSRFMTLFFLTWAVTECGSLLFYSVAIQTFLGASRIPPWTPQNESERQGPAADSFPKPVLSRLSSVFIHLALQFSVYINDMIKSKTGTWTECGSC